MSEPSLYSSSAPVVKTGGTLQPDLGRDLLRVEVDEGTEGLRRLVLHVVASATRQSSSGDLVEYLDGSVFDYGRPIEVSLGPAGNEKIVFKGTISAIEVSFEQGDVPHVTVLAEDELMGLRMTQVSATYTQVSDADVARQIASRHGLTPDVQLDGPTYDVVQQFNQSDLDFLRGRARLLAAEVWAWDGTLHVCSRANRPGTALTLTQGNELLSVSVRADIAHQAATVRVSGFDARQRDMIDETAPSSTIQAEVTGGHTGPQVLAQAVSSLTAHRVTKVPLVKAEAQAYAKAEMLRRARRFVTVRGVTSGSPEMVVGSLLTLNRVGNPFNGAGYYATRVRHTYDLHLGHRTYFDAERPTVNAS
jgi:phage protein D